MQKNEKGAYSYVAQCTMQEPVLLVLGFSILKKKGLLLMLYHNDVSFHDTMAHTLMMNRRPTVGAIISQ